MQFDNRDNLGFELMFTCAYRYYMDRNMPLPKYLRDFMQNVSPFFSSKTLQIYIDDFLRWSPIELSEDVYEKIYELYKKEIEDRKANGEMNFYLDEFNIQKEIGTQILVDAVRYSFGRSTYMPSAVVDYIVDCGCSIFTAEQLEEMTEIIKDDFKHRFREEELLWSDFKNRLKLEIKRLKNDN